MKKQIAERWIAALESGEYKQGMRALRAGDEYCCLGVLCDLMDKDGWWPGFSVEWTYLGEGGMLPLEVMQWAGLKTEHANLAGLNDGQSVTGSIDPWSFHEIAEVIRKSWETL